ncbi:hypothetical protein [Vibrio penaeicida]|uniref:hypothetical protein n=1 Tax=Vibrio penaeicida TaxID=104609 RepID=UPI000CE9C805|nr:hypothetical protein [Vibrio penaeicida]
MDKQKNARTLKEGLSEFYSEKSLSSEQLLTLQSRVNKRNSTVFPYAVVATLLVFVLSAALLFPLKNRYFDISAEIAYNHNSQMQMEIASHSLEDIAQYLNRLDFSLIASQQLPAKDWQLLGARYCSIEGKIAAQISVKNRETKQIHTLYQAQKPDGITSNIEQYQAEVDGVSVKLWEENGLLIGLAN